jgi:hypothetical protein
MPVPFGRRTMRAERDCARNHSKYAPAPVRPRWSAGFQGATQPLAQLTKL